MGDHEALHTTIGQAQQKYRLRAVYDGGATGAYTSSKDNCVPGTVRKLDYPVKVGSSLGGSVWCHYAGTMLLKSNMPTVDEVVVVEKVIIAEEMQRTLISVSHLDDMGYYADHGGNCVRIRLGPHGRTIQALPRVPEGDSGRSLAAANF